MPDADPRQFDLTNAKVTQRDLLGKDGKLIGLWDMAEALRPGTLVVVEANLIVYSFCKPTDAATVCATAAIMCKVN